jgi:hypothetical protein
LDHAWAGGRNRHPCDRCTPADSVNLQRQGLKTVEGQLTLAREEFEAGRAAARPKLEIDAGFVTVKEIAGNINYVAGSEPAYNIEVWGRSDAGYSGGKVPAVLTPHGRFSFVIPQEQSLGPLDAETSQRWPFADVSELPALATGESWVGVTWSTHDGFRGRQLYHQRPGEPRDYQPPYLGVGEPQSGFATRDWPQLRTEAT